MPQTIQKARVTEMVVEIIFSKTNKDTCMAGFLKYRASYRDAENDKKLSERVEKFSEKELR